jgi:hypothetical protein
MNPILCGILYATFMFTLFWALSAIVNRSLKGYRHPENRDFWWLWAMAQIVVGFFLGYTL